MQPAKVVAIHQPNFFPWLGYFNKMAYADVFIVLDNVQLPKKGGTWTNRVRLLINGQAQWCTIPVERSYHGLRLIRDIVAGEGSWRLKLVETLRHNYKRAPHFDLVFPVLSELVNNPTNRLAEYNLATIRGLTTALNLDPPRIVLGSGLNVHGKATDLLIGLVQAVDGTAYLCGGGAREYQVDERFGRQGLDLIYQDFRHPSYSQENGKVFTSGLSIIDALMYCGCDQTRDLIMSSRPRSSIHTASQRSTVTG